MSRARSSSRNLATAVEQAIKKLEKAMAQPGHVGGVSLDEMLDHVNTLSEQMLPEEDGQDSRVSRIFTRRSFRHYQTLGCIDAPERAGKRALYEPRHFVQALLVRKLLWEGAPAERIAEVVAGRGAEETKAILVGGTEVVGGAETGAKGSASVMRVPEIWRRVVVRPGVELHLREGLPKLRGGELRQLLAALEVALRR